MRSVIYLFFIFYFFSLTTFAATNEKNIVPPIFVSAQPTNLSQSPKTIITHEDITTTGAQSLTDALQQLGGLQLQDSSGNGSQVSISMRGFGDNASSNTLILINGVPLTNPDLAPPSLNTIPLKEISYIEIIAGSESVLYGDQAVGGIINIVTEHDMKKKIEISCSGGSYNQRLCGFTLNDHYKQLKYDLNVLANRTHNYRNQNNYNQGLLSGHFIYEYEKGNSAIDYTLGKEKMLYPGALTAAQVAENRRQANNNTDFFSNSNRSFHVRQQQKISPHWQTDIDLAARSMNGNGVLTAPFTQSRSTYFLKPVIKGTLKNIALLTGFDVENDDYHLNSSFGLTHNNQYKYGIFGVTKIPLIRKWSLSLGARVAELNGKLISATTTHTLNRALATTIGAEYELTPHAKFYLRRAGSFRFPKADENAFAPIGVNGLKTQRGFAYETGIKWDTEISNSSLSLYQLNLRDEIAFDPTQTPQTPFGSDQNLSPTVRQGFSLAEKYLLTNKITLGGQYNYVNARFQNGINEGNRIPLVSENILHASMDFKLNDCWNFYTEAVYTGNQFAANDDANLAGKMGGYTIYNFNLRYQFHQFSASFRVNNIFNKYYYLYTVFSTFTTNESFYPAPARNFLLTLNYDFA